MDEEKGMPLGLAFQMALDDKAMNNFSKMTESEKRQVLEAARSVNTKAEMKNIVDDIGRLS